MKMETLTIVNRYTGRKTIVKASKEPNMQIYSISARQFDRVRAKLGHGPIAIDGYNIARIDAYKRNGQLHAVIHSRR